MSTPLNITLFLDGRPGHEKQSYAIVNELERLVDIKVKEVKLPKLNFPGRMLEFLPALFSKRECKQYGEHHDLIIGTGSRTHLPMIAVGRRFNVPVITSMAPEKWLRPFVALCCVPRHDGLYESDNVFLTDGPPVLRSGDQKQLQRMTNRGLILVGGIKESNHVWDSEDMVRAIKKVVEHFKAVQWHITSSPRTPEATVLLLERLALNKRNVEFMPFHTCKKGWVEKEYALSSYAVVTGDSISMMYEAVTSGCKVAVLPVQWKNKENKFKKSIDFLVSKNVVTSFENGISDDITRLETGSFNEARRCALEIVKRFVPESYVESE